MKRPRTFAKWAEMSCEQDVARFDRNIRATDRAQKRSDSKNEKDANSLIMSMLLEQREQVADSMQKMRELDAIG